MTNIMDHIRIRPKYCVWEITTQCNMRCLHCASDFDSWLPRENELSLDEILYTCHELKNLGCEKVILSGGEALLRKDWEDIAKKLVSLEIYVSLISNGFIIDRRLAKRIRDAGICRVALSLDGMESTHNYIRANDKSFDRVCSACSLLKSLNLPVNMVTHINQMNLNELYDMEELIVSLGADVWRLQLGSPVGRLARHPELIIPPGKLPYIADFILNAKRRKKVAISVGDNIGYFSYHESELRDTPNRGDLNFWCGCSAGCLNVGIEANGNIKGCLSLQSHEFVEGNIRTESLRRIWEKPGNFTYTRDFNIDNLHGYCQDCVYGELCRGGCTFMSFGATGSVHNNPYCLYRVINK